MRELLTCVKHGFRWASGDDGCQKCEAELQKENDKSKPVTPKTKLGRIWPVKGDTHK